MPRNKRRTKRNRRQQQQVAEPNQGPNNLMVPSFKKPDRLAITHSTQIQLAESLGTDYFVLLRPCTFAINNTTWQLYTDSFYQNVIMRLADYYSTVEIHSVTVVYQPPFQLAGSLIGTNPTQSVITRSPTPAPDSTVGFRKFGDTQLHVQTTPFTRKWNVYQLLKRDTIVTIKQAYELKSSSTCDFPYPYTCGIWFPDYVGNQPGAYSTPKGTVRVLVDYVFKGYAMV